MKLREGGEAVTAANEPAILDAWIARRGRMKSAAKSAGSAFIGLKAVRAPSPCSSTGPIQTTDVRGWTRMNLMPPLWALIRGIRGEILSTNKRR
jgi:hypothetical protein